MPSLPAPPLPRLEHGPERQVAEHARRIGAALYAVAGLVGVLALAGCFRMLGADLGEEAAESKFWSVVVIAALASVMVSVLVYMGFRLRHAFA